MYIVRTLYPESDTEPQILETLNPPYKYGTKHTKDENDQSFVKVETFGEIFFCIFYMMGKEYIYYI